MGFNIVEKGFQTIRKMGNKWKLVGDAVKLENTYGDVEKLTETEKLLKNKGDLHIFENADFIVDRLNSFIKILDEKDYSGNHDLLAYVLDIDNLIKNSHCWRDKSYRWKYTTNVVDGNKCHIIELWHNDVKVLNVEAKITLSGRLVSFVAMYHSDKGNSFPIWIGHGTGNKAIFDTMVIKILCPFGRDIIFSDNAYDLDLLNSNKVTDEMLKDKWISGHQLTLERTGNRRR